MQAHLPTGHVIVSRSREQKKRTHGLFSFFDLRLFGNFSRAGGWSCHVYALSVMLLPSELVVYKLTLCFAELAVKHYTIKLLFSVTN